MSPRLFSRSENAQSPDFSRSLSLWHTGKKKPIFTQAFAHGVDETPRWVTSLAHLRGTDLFVSGE